MLVVMTSTQALIACQQHLRDQAVLILKAIRGMAIPKTFTEAGQAVRTLAAAEKLIIQLTGQAPPRAKPARAADDAAPTDTPAVDRVTVENEVLEEVLASMPPMNRQQRRLAERLLRKKGGAPAPTASG